MSNRRRNDEHSPNATRWKSIAAVSVVTVIMAYWLWPTSRVHLDHDGYEATIALYRVCNQQSEEGLEEIEAVFRRGGEEDGQRTAQQIAIDSIIEDARDGRWVSATKACRKLLEDQVQQQ